VGLLVGQAHSAGGPTVEGTADGDDAGTAGAARELDRRLDGLGTAVAEEDARALWSLRDAQHRLGGLDLRLRGEEVADVDELSGLLGDRGDELRVTVPERV